MSVYCSVLMILLAGCQYSAAQLDLESLLDLIVNPTTKEPEKFTASSSAQCDSICSAALLPFLELEAINLMLTGSCDLASMVDSRMRLNELEKRLEKQREGLNDSGALDSGTQCTTPAQDPTKLASLNFEKLGSKYYYIERFQTSNWFSALQKCRQMGAHLASPQNIEEFSAIRDMVPTDRRYWLDINDLSTEGRYMSQTTGKLAEFLLWRANEPNNLLDDEHCIELHNGTMNDLKCYNTLYFICEA